MLNTIIKLFKNPHNRLLVITGVSLIVCITIIIVKFSWLVELVVVCGGLYWLSKHDSFQQAPHQQEFTISNSLLQAFTAVFEHLKAKGISTLTGEEMVQACSTAKLVDQSINSSVASFRFNLTPTEVEKYLAYSNQQLLYFAQQALIIELVQKHGYPLTYQVSYFGCKQDSRGSSLTISFSTNAQMISKEAAFSREDPDF